VSTTDNIVKEMQRRKRNKCELQFFGFFLTLTLHWGGTIENPLSIPNKGALLNFDAIWNFDDYTNGN
jgi:hypothetical protein